MPERPTESDTASDALVDSAGIPIVTINSLAERNAFTIPMTRTRTTRTHIDTQIAVEVILSANAQEEPRAFAEKHPPRFQSK